MAPLPGLVDSVMDAELLCSLKIVLWSFNLAITFMFGKYADMDKSWPCELMIYRIKIYTFSVKSLFLLHKILMIRVFYVEASCCYEGLLLSTSSRAWTYTETVSDLYPEIIIHI